MTNPTPTPNTPTPPDMKAALEALLRTAAKAKAEQEKTNADTAKKGRGK